MTGECSQVTKDNVKSFMSKFDTVMFDCDGVLWHGTTVIPKAPETVQLLKKQGKRVFYITNNSTKTRADYLKKLQSMGFAAELEEIVCTAHVAAVYLKNLNFKDKVYLIGLKSMEDELTDNGIRWTKHENEVKCVLVGADLRFSYEKLARACLYLYRNEQCIFLGTNCDPQFPLKDGRALPGTGCLIEAVATAAGRRPTYIGKPERPVFDFLHDNFHIQADRTLMVGDRLGTDIKLAKLNHLHSLLVLSGVHSLADVESNRANSSPFKDNLVPDFYIDSVTQWAELIES